MNSIHLSHIYTLYMCDIIPIATPQVQGIYYEREEREIVFCCSSKYRVRLSTLLNAILNIYTKGMLESMSIWFYIHSLAIAKSFCTLELHFCNPSIHPHRNRSNNGMIVILYLVVYSLFYSLHTV